MARGDASARPDWSDSFDQLVNRILVGYDRAERRLMLASCHAGAGASTVARGVAVALARRLPGRVLLADANLRTPSLHRALGVPRELGLVEAASSEIPSEDALLWSEGYANLRFVTAGRRVASPVRFLESEGMAAYLKALGSTFEYLVFDSAPVGPCPEALVLARRVGRVVLVIQAESTRWEVAQNAKRLLEEAGVDVLGAVLNRRRRYIPSWLYRLL